MNRLISTIAFLSLGVLVPSAAFANGLDTTAEEAASVNVPFVVAGGVVAAAGVALWLLKKGVRWLGPAAVAAGVVVLALGFIIRPGEQHEASEAVVSIVEPSNGERVDAGKPVNVRVALQNGSIATSPTDETGGHLHLYLDGKLQQMPYSMEAQIEVPAGSHQLKVEYVDHEHLSFDPPVETTITVTAE